MLEMLLATALAATPEPQPRAVPERQARASVRIVRAERIRLGERTSSSVVRSSTVRESDGSTRSARLVEFY